MSKVEALKKAKVARVITGKVIDLDDVSRVRPTTEGKKKVIAVCTSDIQFSHKPPLARSTEENWYNVMDKTCQDLRVLCVKHECPLVVAGDLFELWNSIPELINFVASRLPRETYAVPGNHDLPHHSYGEIKKSAYWTLVEAGVVRTLLPECPTYSPKKDFVMYGFPWGYEVKPIKHQFDDSVPRLAVIHAYCWKNGNEHPGATKESHWKSFIPKLKGFTSAVIGDNHSGFLAKSKGIHLFNCGDLIRRTIAEIDYKPRVGLLWSDGSITEKFMDCSEDVFFDGRPDKVEFGCSDLVEEFSRSADAGISFEESLRRRLNDEDDELIVTMALESLEGKS